jgi:hypothetical protein
MSWAAFQACFEDKLQASPLVNDDETIDKCVEELTSAIQVAKRHRLPNVEHVPTRGPLFPLAFRF